MNNLRSSTASNDPYPVLLEAHHLHYSLGQHELINDVSLCINHGEMVAIIAPMARGSQR